MISCKKCRELMPLVLYKEADEAGLKMFRIHTASCEECSSTFREMQETIRTMGMREPADGRDVNWDAFWTRLSVRLEHEVPERTRVFTFLTHPGTIPRWAYGIAAVLLVAVGVYIGRTLYTPQTPSQGPEGSGPRTAALVADTAQLDERLQDYLERSKALLLGVVNSQGGTLPPGELRLEQQRSRDLVGEAHFLKAALNRPDRQQLRMLFEDLEIVLLQLSNMELKPGVPVVEMIREGVDRRSILLKINVEEIRSAVHEASTSPAGASQKPKTTL